MSAEGAGGSGSGSKLSASAQRRQRKRDASALGTATKPVAASAAAPSGALSAEQKQRIATNKANAEAKLAQAKAIAAATPTGTASTVTAVAPISSTPSAAITASPSATATAAPSDAAVVTELKGDLFAGWSCVAGSALGHCVSRCLAMGKGIAVEFKKRFGAVDALKKQNTPIGGVAVLALPDAAAPPAVATAAIGASTKVVAATPPRYAYYLVTKERYFHKPTYATLTASLEAMRAHCVAHGVTRLCLPRIGCGLDGLEWGKVRDILSGTFKGTGTAVVVYYI